MEAIYVEQSPAVLRFLRNITGNHQQAVEDLLQETMLRAWRHVDSVPADSAGARRWLFTVARHIAIDAARRHRRELATVSIGEIDDARAPHDEALPTYAFRDALSELSQEHRDAVALVYLQGRSSLDAAAELGIPPGTVRSRAHYAKERVRAYLT